MACTYNLMTLRLDSILLCLATLMFLAVFIVAGLLFHGNYREYETWVAREDRMREHVSAAREKFIHQEDYLERLLNDQEFFERVVRQRLGYSRENEIIFRFDEN